MKHLIVIAFVAALVIGCSEKRESESEKTSAQTPVLNTNDLGVSAGDNYAYPHSQLWKLKHVEFVSKRADAIKGTSKDCTKCHEHQKHNAAPVKANCTMSCHMSSDSVGSAPPRRGQVPPGATNSCLECHAEKATAVNGHWPASEGVCSSCHTVQLDAHRNDKKNKAHVTTRPVTESCVSCHDPLALKANVHGAVRDPKTPLDQDKACVNCHDPHGSDRRFFVKAPPQKLCLSCHAKDVEVSSAVTHTMMSDEKSCLNCHENHSSDHKPLMRKRSDEMCLSCHDTEMKVQKGGETIVVDNIADRLKDGNNKHAPADVEESCTTCHSAHGSANQRMLTLNYDVSFHNAYNPGDDSKPNSYALCLDCHNKDRLLSENLTGVHKPTKFRNDTKDVFGKTKSKNLHWYHVVDAAGRTDKRWGISCYTCHDPHGSPQDKLIKPSLRMVRQDSPYRMKIEFRKTDTGGVCMKACHKAPPEGAVGPYSRDKALD